MNNRDAPRDDPGPLGPLADSLDQVLAAARVGAWDWHIPTGDLVWNDVMFTVLGIDPGDFNGRIEMWRKLVHPDDLQGALASKADAIRSGGPYSAEYRVRRGDGTFGWVQTRGRVTFGADGEPDHMIGTLWDTTEVHATLDAVGHALRHMSDGFLAVSPEWRITFANMAAERLLGSAEHLLGRLLWETPAVAVPDLEVRCRQAVADETSVGFEVCWPTNQRWYHMRLVPAQDGLTIYFTDVTDKLNHEAERAAAERAEAERAARIARLTVALAEALTVRDVVDAVAEHVLPPFGATGLMICLVDGDRVRPVGTVGYDQDFVSRIPLVSPKIGELPMADVIRDRVPRFIPSAEDYVARYPKLADYPSAGGKRAWAFLPLVASGRPVGSCVVSFSQPRHFTGEERSLLTTISALVAQALERARLYDAEHTRAQALQRELLPRALPRLPAVTAAARYLPARQDMEVGGDWYDIIPLSAHRVALVIGDVMGHGVSEAVTMGRLRTAVRTLADLELPPDDLLSHLNDLVSEFGDDFYATCLYSVYDPASRSCVFACAGHPPPAIVHPDGTVRFPGADPNPPLGAATPPFDVVETVLPEDSLLVLYTDGLVESADLDIDQGMAGLARALTTTLGREGEVMHHSRGAAAGPAAAGQGIAGQTAAGQDGPAGQRDTAGQRGTAGQRDTAGSGGLTGGEPADGKDARGEDAHGEEVARLEALCDVLTTSLLPVKQVASDDAALLIARLHALPADAVASWPLPEDPTAAREARAHVREQLERWGLDALSMTTELLASELVGNVIRHAKGPIRLRLLRSTTLICEVSDGSPTTPRIRRASEFDEGGRGLQLVAALSQRWGTRYTAMGKCIWTEQPLPPFDPDDKRPPTLGEPHPWPNF